jgi:hypothetical protein
VAWVEQSNKEFRMAFHTGLDVVIPFLLTFIKFFELVSYRESEAFGRVTLYKLPVAFAL